MFEWAVHWTGVSVSLHFQSGALNHLDWMEGGIMMEPRSVADRVVSRVVLVSSRPALVRVGQAVMYAALHSSCTVRSWFDRHDVFDIVRTQPLAPPNRPRAATHV